MPKRSYNLTDENYQRLKQLAIKYNVDMSAIVNMSIATFSEQTEDKALLKSMQFALRNSEQKLNVLYSALNNFFLGFAGNMDAYVKPEDALHTWIKQAKQDEEARLRQLAAKASIRSEGREK